YDLSRLLPEHIDWIMNN
ncbi:hypothetical protein CWATWH0003_3220b4, partial [Crocosphaera watsonii WH 0003]